MTLPKLMNEIQTILSDRTRIKNKKGLIREMIKRKRTKTDGLGKELTNLNGFNGVDGVTNPTHCD